MIWLLTICSRMSTNNEHQNPLKSDYIQSCAVRQSHFKKILERVLWRIASNTFSESFCSSSLSISESLSELDSSSTSAASAAVVSAAGPASSVSNFSSPTAKSNSQELAANY